MIVTIWKDFFEIWEQRNNLVHGTDKSSQDLAKRSKANAQIKHLYTQQDEVLAAHQSCIFMRDTEAELDSYSTDKQIAQLGQHVETSNRRQRQISTRFGSQHHETYGRTLWLPNSFRQKTGKIPRPTPIPHPP
jgi:hypothetical protein